MAGRRRSMHLFLGAIFLLLLAPTAMACEVSEVRVVLATAESLGAVLSEKLRVLSFVQDTQGRGLPLEATGLVEVGDTLTSVNGVAVTRLSEAIAQLQTAEVPRTLLFRAAAPRCVPEAAPVVDDTTVRVVNGGWTETFFAVKSDFGDWPQCYAHPLTVAQPLDACEPLRNNVSEHYVVVQSSHLCSPHQQALVVGRAGGRGVLLAQYAEKKPEAVRLPPQYTGTIRTPVIMVSHASGQKMASMVLSSPTPPLISLMVSPQCKVTTATTLASTVQDALAAATAGNLVALAQGQLHSYPYLKGAASPSLGLGRFKVRFAVHELCSDTIMRYVKGAFVVAPINTRCSQQRQVQTVAANKALGIVFSASSPSQILHRAALDVASENAPLALPTVYISASTADALSVSAETGDVYIEFEPTNTHEHHFEELLALSDMTQWPAAAQGRHVLYHRVRRALAIDTNGADKVAALDALYAQARHFHADTIMAPHLVPSPTNAAAMDGYIEHDRTPARKLSWSTTMKVRQLLMTLKSKAGRSFQQHASPNGSPHDGVEYALLADDDL
ncbi:hypothetical protein SPRG_05318 [Saprolegnia parasitica CBS 223.65]|uniref:PDZ domain-containing protein n=1 Tax=Saprolegnia parasitica (strain CBS 223.65) TaxID=695850 RepID=A0A067CUC3_SAPPC|nr:hypothetical protein SPRG_05318 [Saprolegnia parasitica CBS 223.65]KDO30126.1 hypothetical protein SPRG_05318 [Saprolegnia parasitica CBS 223.65]|eukprot:XP_012199305.1 hypothetical protein SPRG_05318 [Saprolegnia parasitica CBS 223.65]